MAASLADICLRIDDNSTVLRSAVEFFGTKQARDASQLAARLGDQFIKQNRRLANVLGVALGLEYDGRDVHLRVTSSNQVGAVPLVSPVTARNDFGLLVKPRFAWDGIGPMLSRMGWRVAPAPLKLPLLKRSERQVPRWVLASMILTRVAALLETLDRRFELVDEVRAAPRGSVQWGRYATEHLSRAQFLSVPCRFPDLRDDRLLLGAIRHTLQLQLQALEGQRGHGAFILRLIEWTQLLLQRVGRVPIHIPSSSSFALWHQRPLRSDAFLDGLQAIEWTVDERMLAGLSDLEGVPWRLPMDQFFESWVETVGGMAARATGGTIRSARQRQTTHAIQWQSGSSRTQQSLMPDLWLEWPGTTLVIDAKYKAHWDRFDLEHVREEHRHDLHQVLAYAALASTPRVIACLAYPCPVDEWSGLRARGRHLRQAEIFVANRRLNLWLMAMPMSAEAEDVAGPLATLIRDHLAAA